jgi:hypothetical protein
MDEKHHGREHRARKKPQILVGLCSSLNQHQTLTEALPHTLSSRPKRREEEGPAVLSIWHPIQMRAPLSPLSSRAYPDFLFAALERAACAVFCKENRMKIATSPTLTGNPGQPRDLQFSQPASNPNRSAPHTLSSRPKRSGAAPQPNQNPTAAGTVPAHLQEKQHPRASLCWPDSESAKPASAPGKESRYPEACQERAAAPDPV